MQGREVEQFELKAWCTRKERYLLSLERGPGLPAGSRAVLGTPRVPGASLVGRKESELAEDGGRIPSLQGGAEVKGAAGGHWA